MQYKIVRLFVATLIVSASFCCKTKSQETSSFSFKVDTALVSKKCVDAVAGIQYRLPSNWIDSSINNPLGDKLPQVLNSVQTTRLQNFLTDSSGTRRIAVLNVQQVPDSNWILLKSNYKKVLDSGAGWQHISFDEFDNAGMHFHQYMMSSNSLAAFKFIVFVKEKAAIQFDFLMPADSTFANSAKMVESVIGSLSLNIKKQAL